MERARHRRSKSTTTIEGNFQIPKQKAVPKLVSDSCSYSEGITKEDVFTTQLGQNSLKRGCGTPIKNLLAEEMAKESEGRRRSPNVIARLMGLDGLPSPQHGHRQQRRSSDKHPQRNASKDIHQNKQNSEDWSSRRSLVDEQHFKDVYEDLEASHVTNRQYSSKWSADSRLTKPEMALIQQKFMDAKRLSSNEKLQTSKEFDGTLEMLDSNKDLLLRYLQQPNSLSVKHLHDLPVAPCSPFCSHVSSLEPSNSSDHECNAKSWKSERDNTCRHEFSVRQKREDALLLQAHNRRCSHSSCNPSKNYVDVKNQENMLPTRIVVLKPNISKSGNCAPSASSPASSHAHLSSYRKRLECTSAATDGAASRKKKNSSPVLSSNCKSREDRAIAKEITRRMRENFGPFSSGLNDLSHSGVKGYAGDESSYDAYESDSSSVPEGITLSSRPSLVGYNWFKRSSSSPTESSVSKEAKKRLSERWKMTHRCQDVELVGTGSTLGQMLAVIDRETRTENVDVDLNGDSDKYCGWDGPLGISSRDGFKDGYVKDSSRSRSLSPTSLTRSHRANGQHEALVDDPVSNKKMHRDGSKANISEIEDYSLKNAGSSTRKPHLCHGKFGDSTDSVYANFNLIQAEISLNKGDQCEKHTMFCQGPTTTNTCSSSIIDLTTEAKHERLISSTHSSVDLLFKHPNDKTENRDSSPCDQEDKTLQEPSVGQLEGGSTSLQCPGPEPDSSESSKEADHPSPVSVLDIAFAEDVSSSSDCFSSVNSGLHGLRMQLQLLKMESEGYSDTPMLIASSEDMMQHPELVYEEKCISGGESWESSYIVNVLSNSGLQNFELDTFFAMWYSPECPLDPWVFDDLEKKYCREKEGLKLERKLLFDRINLALLDIFQHYMAPYPWAKAVTGVNSNWQKHRVKDTLYKMLANQENSSNGGGPEKILDREMNWLGFRDDVDILGKEIEKLLIDDLIGEVVTL